MFPKDEDVSAIIEEYRKIVAPQHLVEVEERRERAIYARGSEIFDGFDKIYAMIWDSIKTNSDKQRIVNGMVYAAIATQIKRKQACGDDIDYQVDDIRGLAIKPVVIKYKNFYEQVYGKEGFFNYPLEREEQVETTCEQLKRH